MLQTETVKPGTLGVLKSLMGDNSFADFFLVGGTALSLQIGHRESIDIDLFSLKPFDGNQLLEHLEKMLDFKLNYEGKNAIKGKINNIQVDFITHDYPLIEPIQNIEGLRIAGLKDIAAMKLNAITGNGTRLKDYIDVAYLSQYMSLEDMTEAYKVKYSSRNPFAALKSLSYHEDINFDEHIKLIHHKYTWKGIEKRINQMITFPDKIFEEM